MEKNKNNILLPLAIVIAGALVAGAMFYSNRNTVQPAAQQAKINIIGEINLTQPNANDSITGNLDADVVVVEYSDTECPYCKVFHQTMQQVVQNYAQGGKVAWIYRHMPLDVLHKKARNEAQAIECAKQQGGNEAFWNYINQVFTKTNSNDSLDPAELPKIATSLKLDTAAFQTCLSTNATADIVKAQEKTGADAGVQGTPNNFLVFKKALSKTAISNLEKTFEKYPDGIIKISPDGKIVNLAGAMPYDLMTLVIDNALNTK